MANAQFPKDFYVKTLNTSVTEKLCQITCDKNQLLRYIVLSVLKNGTSAGSESLTLKLYTSWDLDKAVMVSSSARLLTATGATAGQSWLGRLRFDFEGYPLTAGNIYYLRIQTTSYTRTASYYLAAVLDWPDTVYTQGGSVSGAQIRLIGDSERSNDMAVGGEVRLVEVAEGTVITAPSDMTVPAAASAIPMRFVGALAGSPVEEIDTVTGAYVQLFSDGGTEKAIAFVKVPQGYLVGTQLILLAAMYSRSTSNTIKLAANTYLLQPDSDAMSSTTHVHASTNSALTNATTANRYRVASIDITNGSGQVNGQTVEAGDTLRVELTRDSATDTDTAEIRFVPDLSEVQYND